MKNSPNKITEALHLYFSGTSLRKTQAHLGVFCNSNCSYVTILDWIKKYATLVGNFTDSLKLKVGEELMSDEMEYSTKGKQTWFVDVMDTKTRYMVSSDFMRSRTIEKLIEVLKLAKTKTEEQVKIVTTYGLQGYPRVLRKTFGLQSQYSPCLLDRDPDLSGEGIKDRFSGMANGTAKCLCPVLPAEALAKAGRA